MPKNLGKHDKNLARFYQEPDNSGNLAFCSSFCQENHYLPTSEANQMNWLAREFVLRLFSKFSHPTQGTQPEAYIQREIESN